MLCLGTVATYEAREHVIRQGEEGHHVVVVLSGMLKVVTDTEFGRPVLLALRGRGDLVGEVSALEGVPRSANAVTCGPVHARLITNTLLLEFLDRHVDAWPAVAASLSAAVRWADDRRAEFAACPAPVRVGRVLAHIAERYGERTSSGWDLDVSLTQADLASLAGVALPTFERAVRRMQQLGLLRRRYRRIVVVDLPGLCRFGEPASPNPIAVRGLQTRCGSEW